MFAVPTMLSSAVQAMQSIAASLVLNTLSPGAAQIDFFEEVGAIHELPLPLGEHPSIKLRTGEVHPYTQTSGRGTATVPLRHPLVATRSPLTSLATDRAHDRSPLHQPQQKPKTGSALLLGSLLFLGRAAGFFSRRKSHLDRLVEREDSLPADIRGLLPGLKELKHHPNAAISFLDLHIRSTDPEVIREQLQTVEEAFAVARVIHDIDVKPIGSRFFVFKQGGIKQNKTETHQNTITLEQALLLVAARIRAYNDAHPSEHIHFQYALGQQEIITGPSLLPDLYPTDALSDGIHGLARVMEIANTISTNLVMDSAARSLRQSSGASLTPRGAHPLRGREIGLFTKRPETVRLFTDTTPLPHDLKREVHPPKKQSRALALLGGAAVSPQMSEGFIVTFDTVGSTKLIRELGDIAFTTVMKITQTRAKTVFGRYKDAALIKDIGDGFTVRFLPSQGNTALNAALAAQEFLAEIEALKRQGILPLDFEFRAAVSYLRGMYVDGRTTVHRGLERAESNEKFSAPGRIRIDPETFIRINRTGQAALIEVDPEKDQDNGAIIERFYPEAIALYELQRQSLPVSGRQEQIATVETGLNQRGLHFLVLTSVAEGPGVIAKAQEQFLRQYPDNLFSATATTLERDPLRTALRNRLQFSRTTSEAEQKDRLKTFAENYGLTDEKSLEVIRLYLSVPPEGKNFRDEAKRQLARLLQAMSRQGPVVFNFYNLYGANTDAEVLDFVAGVFAQIPKDEIGSISVIITTEPDRQDPYQAPQMITESFRQPGVLAADDYKVVPFPALERREVDSFVFATLREDLPRSDIRYTAVHSIPGDALSALFQQAGGTDSRGANPQLLFYLVKTYFYWDEGTQIWATRLTLTTGQTAHEMEALVDETLGEGLSASGTFASATGSMSLEWHAPPSPSGGTPIASETQNLDHILVQRLRQFEGDILRDIPFLHDVLEAAAVAASLTETFRQEDIVWLLDHATINEPISPDDIAATLAYLDRSGVIRRHPLFPEQYVFVPPRLGLVIRGIDDDAEMAMAPQHGLALHRAMLRYIDEQIETEFGPQSEDFSTNVSHQALGLRAYHLAQATRFARDEQKSELWRNAEATYREAMKRAGARYEHGSVLYYAQALQDLLDDPTASISTERNERLLEIDLQRATVYGITRPNTPAWRETVGRIKVSVERHSRSLPPSLRLRAILSVSEYRISNNEEGHTDWLLSHKEFVDEATALPDKERADFYLELGRSYVVHHDRAEATKYYDVVEQIARRMSDPSVLADVLFRRARHLHTQAVYGDSIEIASQALQIYETLKRDPDIAKTRIVMGQANARLGIRANDESARRSYFAAALVHYEEAETVADRVSHREGKGYAIKARGMIAAYQGQRARALELFAEAENYITSVYLQRELLMQRALITTVPQEGIRLAEEAQRLSFNSSVWYESSFALVVSHMRAGNRPEALRIMRAVLRSLDSQRAQAQYRESAYYKESIWLAQDLDLTLPNFIQVPARENVAHYLRDLFSEGSL